jgi:hypothetical protein
MLPPDQPGLFQITDDNGLFKFGPPATSRVPKLYIVSDPRKAAPIYVGITKQSMRTRLRIGWTADGSSGYHGYKWRDKFKKVALDLW